jgi:hypothetical protein
MLNFDTYLLRHGEAWVLDIIERLERYEHIRPLPTMTLEQRWDVLMTKPSPVALAA